MKLLVTGGAGFIGSCFVKMVLRSDLKAEIINIDKLTYAGNLNNLSEVRDSKRHQFIYGDIADWKTVEATFSSNKIDAVIHFAAESHVDRSIEDSTAFVRSNIVGTHLLLEAARRKGVKRFLHVSTDEVYGALGERGFFTEETPLAPNSPYAASKASADFLVRSYFRTYGVPVVITRCSNNYGPYQYPEKLIPLFIIRALQHQVLPLYGDGLYVRDWIHVEDHCRALICILEDGKTGEVYNVGSRCEKKNIEIALEILRILDRPQSLLQSVTDRLGHDRRYAMDPSKLENTLHWKPRYQLEKELPNLIQWYKDHESWWRKMS